MRDDLTAHYDMIFAYATQSYCRPILIEGMQMQYWI